MFNHNVSHHPSVDASIYNWSNVISITESYDFPINQVFDKHPVICTFYNDSILQLIIGSTCYTITPFARVKWSICDSGVQYNEADPLKLWRRRMGIYPREVSQPLFDLWKKK